MKASRILRLVVTISILLATIAIAHAAPAGALGGEAQDYVNRINALRTSQGLNALIVDGNLTALAQQHSQEMAAAQNLYHTPSLQAGVSTTWAKLGENVGMGTNTDLIWNAFLNSPHHYENLVDPAFTHVGVGVAFAGVQWTTHRFMQISTPVPTIPQLPAPQPTAPPVTAPPAPQPTAPPVVPATRPPTTVAPTTVPPTTAAPAPAPTPSVPPPADAGRVASLLDALRDPR